jgi:hypothetical protein
VGVGVSGEVQGLHRAVGLEARNCVPLGVAGSTGETTVSEGAEGLLGVGVAAKRGGTPGLEGAESSVSEETLLGKIPRKLKDAVLGVEPTENAEEPTRTKRHKRTRTQGGDVQPRTTPETDSKQTRDVHKTRLRRMRRRSRRGSWARLVPDVLRCLHPRLENLEKNSQYLAISFSSSPPGPSSSFSLSNVASLVPVPPFYLRWSPIVETMVRSPFRCPGGVRNRLLARHFSALGASEIVSLACHFGALGASEIVSLACHFGALGASEVISLGALMTSNGLRMLPLTDVLQYPERRLMTRLRPLPPLLVRPPCTRASRAHGATCHFVDNRYAARTVVSPCTSPLRLTLALSTLLTVCV